jgi:periplasmic protein TonB
VPQPAPEPEVDEALLAEYQARLRAAIERERRYPVPAVRRGLEGDVRVGFRVRSDGRIEDIVVLEGSGHAMLDEAAIEAIRRVGRAQPPPHGIGGREFEILLEFRLR